MKEKVSYIIRKDGEYLVALAYLDSKTPRWSVSAWDAVRIIWREDADRIVEKLGGEVLKFSNVRGVIDEQIPE